MASDPDAITPSDRIRDAGKWLIGASAAVGAALIAGSQLSDLGTLPVCASWSQTCLRLPVALGGAILALGGIAYVMWRAVQVLLPVEVPIDDLIRSWKATLGWEDRDPRRLQHEFPEIAYFRANRTQIGDTDPETLKQRRSDAWKRLDDARSAAEKAVAPAPKQHKFWQKAEQASASASADAVKKAEGEYERARDSVEVVQQAAQYQRLLGSFGRLLRRLLVATVVTALGITSFAWASNPGSPSIDLTGARLVGADLRGVDLSQATLVRVDLTAADLAGSTLEGASLRDVVWKNTTCPDGTNSDASTPATCLGHLSP